MKERREPTVVGNEGRRLGGRELESWASMPDTTLRGGVEGNLDVCRKSSSLLSGTLRGGVGFSELPDGELSVHILSLSLSDSSEMLARWWPRLLEE